MAEEPAVAMVRYRAGHGVPGQVSEGLMGSPGEVVALNLDSTGVLAVPHQEVVVLAHYVCLVQVTALILVEVPTLRGGGGGGGADSGGGSVGAGVPGVVVGEPVVLHLLHGVGDPVQGRAGGLGHLEYHCSSLLQGLAPWPGFPVAAKLVHMLRRDGGWGLITWPSLSSHAPRPHSAQLGGAREGSSPVMQLCHFSLKGPATQSLQACPLHIRSCGSVSSVQAARSSDNSEVLGNG